ncbi:phycobiliprotein lyase [Microcoleus sp. FACHB-1515]|uniref:phycobiliprotein lyase n=1 Tax=Cyanophyceae TaxID=3028117 RepID=UPI0016893BA2|nr:phycobiliprotein lyase [Microcoleus sp. FACHB-1515]MBD2093119.1 phycobiliprotein lyase [Microcoleus sp. FACHB-1515]
MLSFQDFFVACAGLWRTDRTYHSIRSGEIERSYTEFRADTLAEVEKQRILSGGDFSGIKLDVAALVQENACPGFAIAFDTKSETGEEVSMQLNALFVPDRYVDAAAAEFEPQPQPAAAEVADADAIAGFYLRDEGYSESGAIAGRFTYQPIRQTLEMTTYYKRSVAVDQMRLVAPDVRLRTIVTYQRPPAGEPPSVITLIGFGVEKKDQAS